MKNNIRVRFAPSPTGFMHLGNVRAALLNYLFAKQHNGTFILRIEDTDEQRNIQEATLQIFQDLRWLSLRYQEGCDAGGDFGPYQQSERKHLYDQVLVNLIELTRVYRCFCSPEILEEKRQQQIAAHKPPRYDRTCLHYPTDKIQRKLEAGLKFIWRFQFNNNQLLDMHDLAKGTITFDTQHFSDFAVTREDGSHTFIFANFVDDYLMRISHVIRGEDHTSNTAMQLALYDALAVKAPTYWHLPIICNLEGTKLSKRDFGFSLGDLRKSGYLPEAICNYLAIIGGSFEQEIQSLDELVKIFNFKHIPSSSGIRYDVEKLTWFNHKWINKISTHDLCKRLKPFLHTAFPQSKKLDDVVLEKLVEKVKSELHKLEDIQKVLGFYFQEPVRDQAELELAMPQEKIDSALEILRTQVAQSTDKEVFLSNIKLAAKAAGLSIKEIFTPLRFMLTGTTHGIGIQDLLEMLDFKTVQARLLQN